MGIRFSYINHVDSGGISASSEVSTLPVSNIQDPRPTKVWRSAGTSAEYLAVDLGSAKSVSVATILCHNLSASAQPTLKAHSVDDDWGNAPFSESLDHHPDLITKFFSTVAYRYWRLNFNDSSNPDGYIQIGRFWLGTYFQPERDFSRDFAIQRVDPSITVYSDAGSKTVCQRTPYRQLNLVFPSTEDKEEFDTLFNAVGREGDLLAFLDPNNIVWSDGLHEYTIYCHLASSPEWVHRIKRRWSLRLRLRETI